MTHTTRSLRSDPQPLGARTPCPKARAEAVFVLAKTAREVGADDLSQPRRYPVHLSDAASVRRALRTERMRGRAGHPSYDVDRHLHLARLMKEYGGPAQDGGAPTGRKGLI